MDITQTVTIEFWWNFWTDWTWPNKQSIGGDFTQSLYIFRQEFIYLFIVAIYIIASREQKGLNSLSAMVEKCSHA